MATVSGALAWRPDAERDTIRHFQGRLPEMGTLRQAMKAFDWQRQKTGYMPMYGRIVDASLDDQDPRDGNGFGVDRRWESSPAGCRHGQHQFRGLGRQRLTIKVQREVAVGAGAGAPHRREPIGQQRPLHLVSLPSFHPPPNA